MSYFTCSGDAARFRKSLEDLYRLSIHIVTLRIEAVKHGGRCSFHLLDSMILTVTSVDVLSYNNNQRLIGLYCSTDDTNLHRAWYGYCTTIKIFDSVIILIMG